MAYTYTPGLVRVISEVADIADNEYNFAIPTQFNW